MDEERDDIGENRKKNADGSESDIGGRHKEGLVVGVHGLDDPGTHTDRGEHQHSDGPNKRGGKHALTSRVI